jgi:hypothetical protein
MDHLLDHLQCQKPADKVTDDPGDLEVQVPTPRPGADHQADRQHRRPDLLRSAGIQVPPRIVLQPQAAVSVHRRMRRSAFVSHHHATRLRVVGGSSNTIQIFHQHGVTSPDKNGRVPVFVLT